MTSLLNSDIQAQPHGAPSSVTPGSASNPGAPQTSAPPAEAQADVPADIPHVASPPTSPWWTAPAGKAVDIPAFGRTLIEALLAMLLPAPRPVPVRIRARR